VVKVGVPAIAVGLSLVFGYLRWIGIMAGSILSRDEATIEDVEAWRTSVFIELTPVERRQIASYLSPIPAFDSHHDVTVGKTVLGEVCV
jgi:hypothetical protein